MLDQLAEVKGKTVNYYGTEGERRVAVAGSESGEKPDD